LICDIYLNVVLYLCVYVFCLTSKHNILLRNATETDEGELSSVISHHNTTHT